MGEVHSATVSRPYEEQEQVRGSHTITLHWYSNQQEEGLGVHGGPPGGQYHHLHQEGLGVHGGPPGVHGRPLGGEYHHFRHCSAAPAYYHARLTLGSIVHIKHKTLFSFQRQIQFSVEEIHVKDNTNLEQQSDYDEELTHDRYDAHLKRMPNTVSPSSTRYTLATHDNKDRNAATDAAALPVGWKMRNGSPATKNTQHCDTVPDGWKVTLGLGLQAASP